MDSLRLTILIATAAICAVGVVTAVPKDAVSLHESRKWRSGPEASPNTAKLGTTRVVDGAVNPQLIPDQVSYTLLFRLLSERSSDEQKNRIRSYITQMNLGDADALLSVVDEFQDRVGVLDRKAEMIHEREGPNLDSHALAQLNQLQQRKEKAIAQIVESLPTRLTRDNMKRLRNHIDQRVKPKIRMHPDHTHQ